MIDIEREAQLRQAIELFYFAYRNFTEGPDRVLARRGLNRAHHRILYFVGRNPGIGVGGLLKILAVTKQALNAPLRQLMEMGLIESAPAGHDRRVRCLNLTSTGKRLEAQLTGIQMGLLERTFTTASSQDAGEAGTDWFRVMRAMCRDVGEKVGVGEKEGSVKGSDRDT